LIGEGDTGGEVDKNNTGGGEVTSRRCSMWQNIAYILIVLGFLTLIGWAVKGFFLEDTIPMAIRVAVGIIGVGVIILLIVAIRDRMKKAKTDDFKGVER
jgi:hypothetical protein